MSERTILQKLEVIDRLGYHMSETSVDYLTTIDEQFSQQIDELRERLGTMRDSVYAQLDHQTSLTT